MKRPRDNAAATDARSVSAGTSASARHVVRQKIPHRPHRLRYWLVLLVLVLGVPTLAQSQAPLERMYGVSDTEFFIGAWPATRHPSDRVVELWNLWDALGLSFMIRPAENNPARIDTLAWSAGTTRRMVVSDDELNNAGWGRNVQFYLFDSVETPYMACKFMGRSGGTYRSNPDKNDLPHYPQERVYSTADSTVANQVIANRIVFEHRPTQVYRFAPSWIAYDDREDSLQNTWQFLRDHRFKWDDSLTYLVATGHLFVGGTSQATDQLFKLEVFYEVDKDEQYYNSSNALVTATDSLSFLAATRYVTKADLDRKTGETYDKYQEAVFPLDLKVLANGQRGPRFNRATAQRLNIRVTWLGGEQVALRSIALRDSLGQLMFGRGASHDAYRSSLMDRVRRLIFGASLSPDSLRRSIIGIYSGEEHSRTEYAGYTKFDKMLRDSFNFVNPTNSSLRDSLPAFSAQSNAGRPDKDHDVSRPQAVLQETYLNFLPNPNDAIHQYYPGFFNVPYAHLPSIAEQNGGRFHVPLLPLTQQGVEDYETTLQYAILGFNQPDSSYAKLYVQNLAAYKLGGNARVSRNTGRRFILVPSSNSDIHFPIDRTVTPPRLDTMIGHIPTAAETRLLVSMALAYGAKGIAYWWYGGYQNFINNYDSVTQLWYSEESIGGGFGPSGPLTTDSSQDFSSSFAFTSSDSTPRITVPNLFVGRGTRSRAFKKEVQWLQAIGGEMMKLTWKNTYSLHYATARSGTNDEDYGFGTRPLPSNEIISEVKSYKLNDTIPDAPEATYVELGLFDKKTGTTSGQADPKKDTHYVFVVNRRTFEPPDYGTAISQARRDSMVALAENRRIRLKLNLLRKDFQQYEFVQVREVAADTTRLVGDSIPRQSLKIILPADGTIELLLRPGAGSLLEIVYKQPDESVIAGKLETNNQHKMVYINGRYYCVYTKDTARWVNCPGLTPQPTTSSFVFLRRSLPVDTTGVILWEPMEDSVDYDHPCTFLTDNRHPALTVRRTGSSNNFTVATVTWTAHARDTNSGNVRAVYARDIGISSSGVRFFGNIERVAYYHPTDPNKLACRDVRNVWGTPVVCRTSKGYTFAYSCAKAGIVARVRQYTPGLMWPVTGAYSGYDSISLYNLDNSSYGRGVYPSVPAFAHEGLGDSTCGIAWQQPERQRPPLTTFGIDFDLLSGDTIRLAYQIRYARLKQIPGVGGAPALSQSYRNFRFSNNSTGPVALAGYTREFNDYRNPCIDQTQDIWGRIQEMVTYQSLEPRVGNGETESILDLVYILKMRSVYTDPQSQSWLWGEFAQQIKNIPWNTRPADWVYKHRLNATVGSLNDMTAAVSTSPVAFFSIAYNNPSGSAMRQTTARYTEPLDSARKKDAKYSYGGTYPQASCAPQHQATNEAVLYQGTISNSPALRTTRQFFARTRPTEYLAHGRSLAFSVDDSSETAFHTSLFDVWYATDSVSVPLHLAALPNYQHMEFDSLGQVPLSFRTATFQAHDSVQIGFSLSGMFGGVIDTTSTARVRMSLDLMNATVDTVVAVLDSAWITMSSPDHGFSGEPVLDLLSGSYYIRLRLDTMNIPAVAWNPYGSPMYPVVDLHGWMGDDEGGLNKLRRESSTATAQARIDAQPNPFTGTTELRFSIPKPGYTTVRVFDPVGRLVGKVVPQQWMDVGRYAVEFDGGQLQPGTYLVELMIDQQRVVEKIVVVR